MQQLVGNKATGRLLNSDNEAAERETATPLFKIKPIQENNATKASSDHAIARQPDDRPTLQRGDRGQDVELLQNKIRGLGAIIEVDGIFGEETENQVIGWQAETGLEEDGVVGARTWHMLDMMARGPAISDEQAQANRELNDQARALRNAGQYQAALDGYMTLYSDPVTQGKPTLLQPVIYNIATCHHYLAFEEGVDQAQRQERLDEAISWYLEAQARESGWQALIASIAIRLREARLGQRPSSQQRLEDMIDEM